MSGARGQGAGGRGSLQPVKLVIFLAQHLVELSPAVTWKVGHMPKHPWLYRKHLVMSYCKCVLLVLADYIRELW